MAHDLGEKLPTAANFGRKTLAHDIAETVGQTKAHLLFFSYREETEKPVHRLAGIDRVQGAENEMAGFRGHERDFHGRAIAHFADKNNLWCLPERGAQAIRITIEVMPEFALIKGGAAGRVNELDRILQGNDMNRLFLVNLIQDRGQGRRLATAGRAGDKHESGFFPGDFLKNRRQPKGMERRE